MSYLRFYLRSDWTLIRIAVNEFISVQVVPKILSVGLMTLKLIIDVRIDSGRNRNGTNVIEWLRKRIMSWIEDVGGLGSIILVGKLISILAFIINPNGNFVAVLNGSSF